MKRFQRAYNTGQITFGERYNKVIDALDPRQQRRGRGDDQLDARSPAAGSTRCT